MSRRTKPFWMFLEEILAFCHDFLLFIVTVCSDFIWFLFVPLRFVLFRVFYFSSLFFCFSFPFLLCVFFHLWRVSFFQFSFCHVLRHVFDILWSWNKRFEHCQTLWNAQSKQERRRNVMKIDDATADEPGGFCTSSRCGLFYLQGLLQKECGTTGCSRVGLFPWIWGAGSKLPNQIILWHVLFDAWSSMLILLATLSHICSEPWNSIY